jgi:ATP-dependent DNA helicase RecQ
VVSELGRPPVVALTATASPPVRDDIVARLALRSPLVIVAGPDRTNLFLEAVQSCGTPSGASGLVAVVVGQRLLSPG